MNTFPAYAANRWQRPQRDEDVGDYMARAGKFKDATGRGFRSSLSFPALAKAPYT